MKPCTDNIINDDFVGAVRRINEIKESQSGAKPRAFVRTYGCQQNESDSERIKGLLEQMGYAFADSAEQADLVIFNTCAVREHAEQRVFGNVGALKPVKEDRRDMIIGLCGCMMQQEHIAEKIKKSYPYVDLVFGTHALHRLPELLYEALDGKRVFELGGGDDIVEDMPVRRDGGVSAWLPVMYGCNNFCTYCIVPYVRGRERSREPEKIIDEARSLIASGARDITLLGQNVNSYGKNLDGGITFAQLLREINGIAGEFRIRFMTSHPKDATPELFDAMGECGKVARHLHLPFQSGSSRVLKLMNRGYTKEKYLSLISAVKEKVPGISLSSDIIVGFPGETYDDFKETLDVVKRVEFDNLYTFIYSKRRGTPAEKLDDPVPYAEKSKWFSELIAVQEEITSRHMDAFVGKTVRVLCDSAEGGQYSGRTDSNQIVLFGCAKEVKAGDFADVKITESHRTRLIGEAVYSNFKE